MKPLEMAAWWTLFGAVTFATVGGVFSGLTEVEEDRASALATSLRAEGEDSPDLEYPRYETEKSEYEEILQRGNRYQWVSRSFMIVSGAALVAAVTLFIVHHRRDRRRRADARVRLEASGIGVRF